MIQFNAALAVAPWYYLNEASPRNIGQQGTLQSEAKFRSREKYLSGGVAQKVSDDKWKLLSCGILSSLCLRFSRRFLV